MISQLQEAFGGYIPLYVVTLPANVLIDVRQVVVEVEDSRALELLRHIEQEVLASRGLPGSPQVRDNKIYVKVPYSEIRCVTGKTTTLRSVHDIGRVQCVLQLLARSAFSWSFEDRNQQITSGMVWELDCLHFGDDIPCYHGSFALQTTPDLTSRENGKPF